MGGNGKQDWVALVERGYRLELSEMEWLDGIVEVAPFYGDGPVVAYGYELVGDELQLTERAFRGGDDIAWMLRLENGFPEDVMALNRLVRSGQTFGTMSETLFTKFPFMAPAFVARMQGKYVDVMGSIARDGRESGVMLSKILREPRSSTAPERRRWRRVGSHLGAGRRLRRRLTSFSLDDESVEAVFEPDGAVCDARAAAREGTALEALRAAVRRIDRARSRSRADADEALDLWQGLVRGRWSIVDRFDTDGRRYLVAHRNEIGLGDPRGLTPREEEVAELTGLGESNKAIGYRLGVSPAAVSAAVRRAIRKLDLRGRAELASFFAPGGMRWSLRRIDVGGNPMVVARSAGLNLKRLKRLTEAERSIALALVAGRTNKSIAQARGRSSSTVANQIAGIFQKLDVGNRAELAVALSS